MTRQRQRYAKERTEVCPIPSGAPLVISGGSPWHGPRGSGLQRSPPRRRRCDSTSDETNGRLPYPIGSPTIGGGSPWHGPRGSGLQRSPPRRRRCDLTREWYQKRYPQIFHSEHMVFTPTDRNRGTPVQGPVWLGYLKSLRCYR